MSITLVGEVVNSCDNNDGWTANRKKPKKDKDQGGGNAAGNFWE